MTSKVWGQETRKNDDRLIFSFAISMRVVPFECEKMYKTTVQLYLDGEHSPHDIDSREKS